MALAAPGLLASRQAAAQTVTVPAVADPRFSGDVLSPTAIPKFVDPLPVPGTGWPVISGTSTVGIEARATDIPILPSTVRVGGNPNALTTRCWSYRADGAAYDSTYLGPTIVARRGTPIDVSYDYTPLAAEYTDRHVLRGANPDDTAVDKTLHGTSGHIGGQHLQRPEPESRFIAHLHGAKGIAPDSDGYTEAWITPDGKTYDDLPARSGSNPYRPVVENRTTLTYPNNQDATLKWYHDHALGNTRLNVYAGLAAAYLLRDPVEDDLDLPSGAYEVPLVIQDRMFWPDGRLAYPDLAWTSLTAKPWPGGTSTLPEFFGDVIVVNGKAWPHLEVEPTTYRLRFLNGCNSRFLDLECVVDQTQAKLDLVIIGTEGGLLNAPVRARRLLIAPAERFDVLVDFSGVQPGQTVTMHNKGAKKPFPKGTPPNPQSDRLVLQFRGVAARPGGTPSPYAVPGSLRPAASRIQPAAVTASTPVTRVLLFEGVDPYGRIQPLLGDVVETAPGIYSGTARLWEEDATETPPTGQLLVWEIFNTTADSHPIHIHETLFQVLDRQGIRFRKGGVGPDTVSNMQRIGSPRPPEAWERVANKDTVIAYPGEVTRIALTFGTAGCFVWHCHILEHEDHEMMRPLNIGRGPKDCQGTVIRGASI